MTIKEYKCKTFTLKLCDFRDNEVMSTNDNILYFRLSIECDGKWMTDYVFDTHNFGMKNFDEIRFKNTIEQYNIGQHNINFDIDFLTEVIRSFYPLNQYIRIIGL